MDKYQQIKKYIFFEEIFQFHISLYLFLNEKFELKEMFNEHLQFEMTFTTFKKYLRKLEKYAADSCGVVCYSDNQCDGHRCLSYMQKYDEFMTYNVEHRTFLQKYYYN